MKQGLIGFGLVLLAALLGWFLTFGATAPCEAMQEQARKLGEAKDARSRGIASALGNPKPGTVSVFECIGMALRIRALGAGGVTVVGRGAQSPTPEGR
jgi:hypothetical protein